MLKHEIEVPQVSELAEFASVQIGLQEEPGVVSLRVQGNDGSEIELTWDEIQRSVYVQWRDGERRLVELTRELITKISVREQHGSVQFWIWAKATDVQSRLVISVGMDTSLTDVSLQT